MVRELIKPIIGSIFGSLPNYSFYIFIKNLQLTAEFYEVKPIRLCEQVNRNANRFFECFMFQLTEDEVEIMVTQNAIPSMQSNH